MLSAKRSAGTIPSRNYYGKNYGTAYLLYLKKPKKHPK
jgi:hypothetical protein